MSKPSLRDFDPQHTGRLDMLIWQAYYNHRFGRMVVLLIQAVHSQFGLNWVQSTKAAYYSGRAATAFRKNAKTKDYTQTIADLETFYTYIRKHSSEDFDPLQMAQLEINWWLVHRYPKQYTQTLEEALAVSMATLYRIDVNLLGDYAKNRAAAGHIRDVATWQTKTEPDWDEIERLLIQAYKSLKEQVRK